MICFLFLVCIRSLLIKKIINHWSRPILISRIFRIFSNIKHFLIAILYRKLLFFVVDFKNLHKPYHVETKLYLVHFDKYFLNLLFFFFGFLYSFCLVNGRQALYVNPSYLKCISGMNLSPANENLFIISFIPI